MAFREIREVHKENLLGGSLVINKRVNKLWKNRVPMRIKVFMWMAMQGKLQIGVNLKKKIGKGNRN